MANIQKHIAEALPAEVLAFATDFLGLDVDPSDSSDTVMNKVLTAQGGHEIIFVAEAAPLPDFAGTPPPFVEGATAPIPAPAMQGTLGRDDPKVTINIANEDRNGEVYSRDVEVGVNGRVWQIRRGVDVQVPYRVFKALQEAEGDSITHDPKTHEEIHTKTRRVPMSVVERPTLAEIAAWHERVDSVELA